MFTFIRKKELKESQYSLHSGSSIFEEIKKRISEATLSIKIAATWFTDNELFQILVTKKKGVPDFEIMIILDDNKENYWLPFMDLIKMGCVVKLSTGVGSNGRMHQKFCIIDNAILINGSYNWSKNARTENHENVIVSTIKQTVDDFCLEFDKLLESSTQYDSSHIAQQEIAKDEAEAIITERERFAGEFEKVLDEMIYSSVVEYNKETLVAKGFERSEKCSGDSNIISNELDTVYTEMLNSISASEQKKELIHAKVATHLQESTSKLKEKFGRERELIIVNGENLIQVSKSRINILSENSQLLKEDIIKIESTEIVNNSIKIQELTEERNRVNEETIKMPFRWYIEIPTYLGLVAVFGYILLFYSSATYILMFSEQEAKAQHILGLPVDKIGIFYPEALLKAFDSGITKLLLIIFVPVFLVLGLIFLKKFKSSFMPKWMIKLVCLILIDGFTAVAVSKSIHENNYIAGIEKDHFQIKNVFTDMNFYLVFIFGMLSLLVFDLVITYVIKNFEGRNDIHIRRRKQIRINQLNEEIGRLVRANVDLAGIVSKKRELVDFNLRIVASIENDIQLQPTITNRKIALLENETNSQITNLENIVKIARNKIENELFNFSTHFIKDRINIFLQGWNNYIYSYYSKSISEMKVQEAKSISNNWFLGNVSRLKPSKNLSNESM